MTLRTILPLALAAALLVAAAGVALAQPSEEQQARRDAHRARVQEMHEARNASLASFKDARAAVLLEMRAADNETKRSFMENKTRVQTECAALHPEATGEDVGEENDPRKNCMRDGMKPLIEKARAEHKANHDAAKGKLLDARKAAMASFLEKRAEINQRHGHRSA